MIIEAFKKPFVFLECFRVVVISFRSILARGANKILFQLKVWKIFECSLISTYTLNIIDFVIIEGEESMPSPSAYELRDRERERERERERKREIEREKERTYLNVEGIYIE